jgi:hypothetical protein
VAIIAAISAAAVAIISALNGVRAKQDIDSAQLITVAKDAEAIKGHVNSERTASDGVIKALRAEIQLLRDMIADKKTTADLLAQAVVQRGREGDTPVKTEPKTV